MGIALGVLAGVVVLLLIVISTRPNTFKVQRSAKIGAPPEVVFPYLNDFHKWLDWSPWEKIDPNLNRTFTGADNGTGAVYDWLGNKQVGQGRMTITDSKLNEHVIIKLEFIKPFPMTNKTTFKLTPVGGDATNVDWIMEGNSNFMSKAFSLFMDFDKMIGKDFEKGLRQLDEAAKAAKG